MTHSKLPAIVVGTGFGCRIHVPALRAAGFDVVALVGADPERTRRRADANAVPHAFTDLAEAIKFTRAVAVTIATPPHTHAAVSMTAVAHGCHVICEKPFAMNLDEARAMLAAAQRANVVHFVGHEFRWLPERAIIARAIAEGLIGEPRLMTLVQFVPLVANLDAKMPRWWFDLDAGGGWLGASGSHIVDQVRHWLGEFSSLSAALPIVSAREHVAEDSYSLRFRLANGVEGTMQQTAGAWGSLAGMARVAGTKGTLWLDGGTVRLADRDGVRELPVPTDLALPAAPAKSADPRHQFSHFELGPYTRLCEAFRDAINGSAAASAVPLPTFADGVASMKVLDAIRASATAGGALVTVE